MDHLQSQPGQTVCETLSQKNPTQNRTGRVAQGLPSKHEALNSNPNTTKSKKKKKESNPSPWQDL
jgi:hypothetical protein